MLPASAQRRPRPRVAMWIVWCRWRSATSSGTRAACARPGEVRRRRVRRRIATSAEGLVDGRPAADRPPEGRARAVLRRLPDDDLRLHPVERPVGRVLRHEFPLPTFDGFYFTEASVLFLVAAVVIGLIRGSARRGPSTRSSPGLATSSAPRWSSCRPRDHGGDEEHLHHRHRSSTGWRTPCRAARTGAFAALGVPREHADRVPRALLVRARRAGHADPGAAGRLRRRRARRSR